MKQAAKANLLRSINRSAVLDLIRTSSPISRSRLARQLNMSLPTVMRIVEELAGEDLVRYQGSSEPTGGRRSPLLEFNGTAHAVIGLDLGGTKFFGTVADLTGTLRHEIRVGLNHDGEPDPDAALEALFRLINSLLDLPLPEGQQIRGMGIGVPGVTLSDSGTVVWAPGLGWRDLPLKEILSEKYALPIFVENDVNLATLGEFGFGVARGTENLVCIAMGTGIGAGIMIDGRLYRGKNQGAGEIGYLLPGLEYLGRRYDKFGALESLASGSGITARAREVIKQKKLPLAAEELSAEDVFALARQGADWAQDVVDETVDLLSLAIASVSALLDPEAIVLSGGVAASADLLVGPIQKRLDGVVPYTPRLVASDLGPRAAVMGAIMLVLNQTTDHVVVSRLP